MSERCYLLTGASGFLCGRAIWQGALPRLHEEAAMVSFLEEEGAVNFLRANAAAERSRPWFQHRKYGGRGVSIMAIYDASLPAAETAAYVKARGLTYPAGIVPPVCGAAA